MKYTIFSIIFIKGANFSLFIVPSVPNLMLADNEGFMIWQSFHLDLIT